MTVPRTKSRHFRPFPRFPLGSDSLHTPAGAANHPQISRHRGNSPSHVGERVGTSEEERCRGAPKKRSWLGDVGSPARSRRLVMVGTAARSGCGCASCLGVRAVWGCLRLCVGWGVCRWWGGCLSGLDGRCVGQQSVSAVGGVTPCCGWGAVGGRLSAVGNAGDGLVAVGRRLGRTALLADPGSVYVAAGQRTSLAARMRCLGRVRGC